MFDVHGSNSSGPVVNYEGVSKNVMSVGFQEASEWMFTGGEDGTARTWDLRMRNLQCQCVFQAGTPGFFGHYQNTLKVYSSKNTQKLIFC